MSSNNENEPNLPPFAELPADPLTVARVAQTIAIKTKAIGQQLPPGEDSIDRQITMESTDEDGEFVPLTLMVYLPRADRLICKADKGTEYTDDGKSLRTEYRFFGNGVIVEVERYYQLIDDGMTTAYLEALNSEYLNQQMHYEARLAANARWNRLLEADARRERKNIPSQYELQELERLILNGRRA